MAVTAEEDVKEEKEKEEKEKKNWVIRIFTLTLWN